MYNILHDTAAVKAFIIWLFIFYQLGVFYPLIKEKLYQEYSPGSFS